MTAQSVRDLAVEWDRRAADARHRMTSRSLPAVAREREGATASCWMQAAKELRAALDRLEESP